MNKNLYCSYSFIQTATVSFALATLAPGIERPLLISAPLHSLSKSFWLVPKPVG